MKHPRILWLFNFLKIRVKLILQFPFCSFQKSASIFATSDQTVLIDAVSVDFFLTIFFLKKIGSVLNKTNVSDFQGLCFVVSVFIQHCRLGVNV